MDRISANFLGQASAAVLAAMMLVSPAGVGGARAQAPAATAAPAAAAEVFTQEELRKLLGPYALYPDDLLAQLLPACAYPIDIVQASRWLEKNKAAVAKGDFSGIDGQPWDPTVKALARFPDVIAKLNEDLDATTDIGDAFVNQPKDVANVIQTLRQEAQKSGALKGTPQQNVVVQEQGGSNYIVIEPTDPGVIYVPTYNPAVVYDSGVSAVGAGLISFGIGVAVGAALDNAWDWGRGWVYPPRWPGYPGYRPGYPGYRPGNVNIGNDVNIDVGNNVGNGNTRPWRPDPGRYRPGQGTKPGLGRPGGVGGPGSVGVGGVGGVGGPGGVGRPGGPGGPGSVGRPGGVGGLGGVGRPGGPGGPGAGGRPDAARPRPQPSRAGQPPAAQRPSAKAPRPSPASSRPTAFSDVRHGGNAAGFSQRGSMSRQSISRPAMGGGGGRGGRGGGGRGGGRGR
ncbi:DUF3300 domain-containing protein [Xanthobacter flavus]|uniref:DUF3300 domain-containing protein n=1 Tax=Xanthobacter flavus TaxID=281 RepID=UPI003728CF22